MKDRVLITPDVIKVSLPGVDVNTADLEDLAFHSDFALLGQVISGYFSLPHPEVLNPGTKLFRTTGTLNLDRTFDGPPIFLCGYWWPYEDDGNTLRAEGTAMLMPRVLNVAPDPAGSFPKVTPNITAIISNDAVDLVPNLGTYPSGTVKYKALI